jgi:hypothetical protein
MESDYLAPNIRAYINEQIRIVKEAEDRENQMKHLLESRPSLPKHSIFSLHGNQRLIDQNTVGLSLFEYRVFYL